MSTPTQTIVGSEQAPTVDDVEKSTLLNGEDGGGDEAVLGMEGSVGEGLGSTSVVQDGDSNPISKVIVGEASEGKTEKLDVNSNLIELGNLENSGGDKVAEFSELNEEIKQTKLKDDVVEEDINTELLNAESSIIASGPKDVTDAGDTKLNSDEAVEDKKAEDEVDENAILHNEADQAEDEADAKAILCNGSDQTIAADEGGDKVAEYLELAEETKESKLKDEVVGEDNKAELLNAESSIIASGPKDVTDARDAKLNSDEVVEDKKTEDEADENATLNNGSDQTTAANEAGDKVAEYSELNEETIEIKLKDEVVDEDKKIELLNAESSVIASGPKDVTDAGDTKLNSDEAVEDKKTEDEVDETATLNNGSDQTEDEADAKAILCNGSDQTTGADLKVIGSDADSEKVLADNVEPTEEEPVGEEIASAEEPSSFLSREVMLDAEDKAESDTDGEGGSVSDDDDTDGLIFGSSEASKRFIEEFGIGSGGDSQSGAGSSRDDSQRIDGQIVTDSDEEADTDEDGDGKELFDSAALTALLKAATSAGSENGSITISAQDASRLFSVERPAGLGSSLQSLKPASRTNRSSLFTPGITTAGESENNLSEEDKKKLEKLQSIRVKFLRLVHRLGLSVEESVAAQVLYRLALIAGRQTGQLFSLDDAKTTAMQLEAEGKDDLDFSVNILVLGKSGVGKSATINSIFGEEKAQINAFEPATNTVKEISGLVDGVKIRVFDTPGLRSSAMEQSFNRSVLSSVKKLTKKNQPDIVYYVDRLDAQTRDLNDLPLLRMITSTLGPSILRSAIVTLTHAASAPPEGPNGSPLSYEGFVTQRSHVVQQSIGQAVGDLRMMSPSLMNPVTLVENHPSCRKNREGQKVLPNGQSWRPQLLLLSYSMKILAEANSVSKPQDPFDHRKLFGFRVRSPPLPYMLSSMLQSRQHPKLSTEQGGDDSDADLADISDSSDQEDEDEYDQLPPFKPLKKAQLANLSKEQQKAYFEEYDYRVKLQQKKQWKEEVKRMREMKKGGNNSAIDGGFMEDDGDTGAAAPVAVPLPDMVLPPSFDSDNSAYRYRFLEPTSQFLARPVLDTHGWDHDCGYDGVNVEQSLAIASRFPAVVAVQVTKDKKEFNFNLDSSIAAKHGDNGSTMAGFDIQPIGKQLAYIVRGETKFKNLKKNKTAAGFTVTFLGENVATGFKVEDQIVLGKQYVFVGSAGTVRSQQDAAYGANIEVQRRELGYPIGQVQSSFGLSIIKWRGDLALGFNSLAQFSVGRGSKVAVRAGINNKLSGQITVKTSSSEHLSLVLAGFVPTVIAIYKKIWPGVNDKYSIY